MSTTLLVTGIHREELGFGDRVAKLLDHDRVDVLRIPEGITHSRPKAGDLFYYQTRHREIYLQVKQQIGSGYRLLIDLHSGRSSTSPCADVFCHDSAMLDCLLPDQRVFDQAHAVRLVKIVERHGPAAPVEASMPIAHTWVPRELWDNPAFTYVGLEIYLHDSDEGAPTEWRFARELIDHIEACVA